MKIRKVEITDTRKATAVLPLRRGFYVHDAEGVKELVTTSITNVTSIEEGLLYVIPDHRLAIPSFLA